MYDTDTFFDTYKYGLTSDTGEAIMSRLTDAAINGEARIKIFDDEMEAILAEQKRREEFDRRLNLAARLNNDGIELEKAGDIAGAIAKYEENILPGSFFSHHPYKRLCVLYRRAGDYDNETRVIETFLARAPHERTDQTDYYKDRLTKAKAYKSKQQQK